MLFSLSIFAQTAQKSDKKTPAESPKITQEIVYCIDGAITKSPLDFFMYICRTELKPCLN